MDMTQKVAGPRRKGRPDAGALQRKRATVLDVARQQFAASGYRAVTMRKIAEQACVSTRTLYNWYADKLALFEACLSAGSAHSDVPKINDSLALEQALRAYAAALMQYLARDTSLGLGLVVYREGAEFPEIAAAAHANQNTWLVEPLAAYLTHHGLEREGATDNTKLFIAMALSEFQRRLAFGCPLQTAFEIDEHAGRVTSLFLTGAATSAYGKDSL